MGSPEIGIVAAYGTPARFEGIVLVELKTDPLVTILLRLSFIEIRTVLVVVHDESSLLSL